MMQNKTPQEIKEWILENCVDEYGDIDLSHLDFSDFNGDINIGFMKVKKGLYQCNQKVERNLYQSFQKVKRTIFQDHQEVEGDLYQGGQHVEGDLFQRYPKVKGGIYQDEVREENKEKDFIAIGF